MSTFTEVRTVAEDAVALYVEGQLVYSGSYIPAEVYRQFLPVVEQPLRSDEAFAQMNERFPDRYEDIIWGEENVRGPSLEDALRNQGR